MEMVQFLDPENAKILQFLDPEIVEMGKKTVDPVILEMVQFSTNTILTYLCHMAFFPVNLIHSVAHTEVPLVFLIIVGMTKCLTKHLQHN